MSVAPGISAWPTPDDVSFPGVTVADFCRLIPAGAITGTPLAPTAPMFVDWLGVPVTPGVMDLRAGLASGAGVTYDGTLGFVMWRVGGPAGASEASLVLKYARCYVPDGPYRAAAPTPPEPSYAVCGFRQSMHHVANPAAGLAIGCGWLVGSGSVVAGDDWAGGPLANGDNDLIFPTNTRPYVCLIKLNAGAYQVRVRGNDGVSRLYPLNFAVDPLLPHVVDFRVYRATLTSPARYALYINGELAWSQLMSEGAGPGNESASPTAGNMAIKPFLSAQGQGGPGIRVWDVVTYRGYDLDSTTDRG